MRTRARFRKVIDSGIGVVERRGEATEPLMTGTEHGGAGSEQHDVLGARLQKLAEERGELSVTGGRRDPGEQRDARDPEGVPGQTRAVRPECAACDLQRAFGL